MTKKLNFKKALVIASILTATINSASAKLASDYQFDNFRQSKIKNHNTIINKYNTLKKVRFEKNPKLYKKKSLCNLCWSKINK